MPKEPSKEVVYDFVNYYTNNPVASACDFLDQDLWWGQRISLEKTWRAMYNLMIWGRGCGKSRFLAVASICKALLNPGEKVVITASSFRQSKMVFKEIEDIYDNSSIFRAACKKMPVRLPDACAIEFTHGSSILAYPLGEGGKIRGARAHTLVIDEAAQVPIDIIEDVLFPMMNTAKNPMENVKRLKLIKKLKALGKDTSALEGLGSKHCVIMSSTAYLRCNHLYERMVKWEEAQNAGNKDYSVTKYTYLDPPEGFINIDQVEMEKKTQPIMRFMMEHLAIFPDDDASSFYPASLVNKIRSNDCPILLSATEPGIYIVGMDPARTSDNCTISVVKVEGDKIKLVFLYAFNNTSFTYVSLFLRMVISVFRPVRVAIDSQGGGYAVYDELNKIITREYAEANLPKGESLVNLDKIDDWGCIDRIDNIQFSDSGSMATDKLYIIQLVNFTTEWIADSNFKLKSRMQTNPPGVLIPTHSKDSSYGSSDADAELNDGVISNSFALIEEMQNIRMTPTRSGAKLQFLASDKRIRRDRYTSFLIACRAAIDYGASLEDESMNKQQELACGFWG